MFEVVILNAKIADGTGEDCFLADVGIKGERIEKIGKIVPEEGKKVIDAKGKLLAPGFIDMHSHADTTILVYPQMESMLHQGITTFVSCQCGHSMAPVGRYWEGSQAGTDLITKLSPKLFVDMYDMDYYTDTSETIKLIKELWGINIDFVTFKEYLDKVDETKISGNIITLIGYNTIRMNTCDPHKAVPPTEEEKKVLKAHIKEAMEAGAFGMSVGLDYKPGVLTTTEELLEMSKEIAPYNGIYFTHWRRTGARTGTPKKQKKIDGIIETLEIGMQNDIQVQISHISSGYDVFPANDEYMQVAGAKRTLQVVDEYIQKGARAYFDVIPNTTGGTMIIPDIAAIFRPWYMFTGGLDLFVENLKYPDYREMVKGPILSGKFYRLNPTIDPDWDVGMRVIRCTNQSYVGKTVRDISIEQNKHSVDTVLDLMIEDPAIKVFRTDSSSCKESIRTFLHHHAACVGNDTFVFNETSTVSYDPKKPNRKPNPNTYCGFIKFILEFGMERIEDSIRKLSGKPAEVLGLSDRGFIKKGYRADLVLLDMKNLKTNEDFIDTCRYPSGVDYVLVNGIPVIENGRHTSARPGGVIRRQSK